MGRLTLNGLNARIDGLDKILTVCVQDIKEELIEIKTTLKAIKENDIEHMRQDLQKAIQGNRAEIDNLKRGYWRLMGGIAVLVTIVEVLARVLPKLLP